MVKYTRHDKRSNFIENFGSGMVRFGSIRVSGPLSGEHISGVGWGMGPGRSVQVSGLRSVLPSLRSVLPSLVASNTDRKPN